MSYSEKVKDLYRAQLRDIRSAGIYKEERFIHSPQAADIEVEFPSGDTGEESDKHVCQQLPGTIKSSGGNQGSS